MGFFNNIGTSFSYLYDIMSFDPLPSYDIGNCEPEDQGEVVSQSITHDDSGNITISIKREKQKRARCMYFTVADIINCIAEETPQYKDLQISKITFTPAYFYNTYGYKGKAINMYVNFGEVKGSRGNGYISEEYWSEIYEHSHKYYFGHKVKDYAKYYERSLED